MNATKEWDLQSTYQDVVNQLNNNVQIREEILGESKPESVNDSERTESD